MKRLLSRLLGLAVVMILVALAVLGGLMFYAVPFEATSFAAWTGIALATAGALFVIKPPRFLGVPRFRWLVVVTLGAAVTITAVLWPTSVVRATGPHQRLDDFLAEYQFNEYHEVTVDAPVERVLEASRAVSLADMPAAVWLLRLRALAAGHLSTNRISTKPLLNLTPGQGGGFLLLDVSNPRELVLGLVGQPWANRRPPAVRTPEEFQAFNAPGEIRVAFNLRVVDEGNGRVRVSTETRTLGNDAEARRLFGRYWRIIYPGSALIRSVWLNAIVSRATKSTATAGR